MSALRCEAVDLVNTDPVAPEVVEAAFAPKVNFSKAKGLCLHCSLPKNERRSLAKFCSDKCRSDFHNETKKRARIVDQALRWRRFRKKGDFTILCKLLDDLNREDKAKGRTYYAPAPLDAHVRVVGIQIQGRKRR